MAQAIIASAGRLGIDPTDLGTAISYETAGTFDPWKAGPTTQHGQHRGLIQWGEPQRKQYGVTQDMSVDDQLKATERYLTDRGVKPGMGLMDIYSAINAGRVGLYNRSDANNGGAPGTVADKVNYQMAGHRAKAAALLGGAAPPAVVASAARPAAAPVALPGALGIAPTAPASSPVTEAATEGNDDAALMAMLTAAAKQLQPQQVPMAEIKYPDLRKARGAAMRFAQAGMLS